MVFVWPEDKRVGQLGQAIGGALGAGGQMYMRNQAMQNVNDVVDNLENKDGLSLYTALRNNFRFDRDADKLAQQVLPYALQRAQRGVRIPGEEGQPSPGEQPRGLAKQQVAPGAADQGSVSPAVADQVIDNQVEPQPQNAVMQVDSPPQRPSPAEGGRQPLTEDLYYNPEMVQGIDDEAVQSYYQADPTFKIEDHAGRIRELSETMPQNEAIERARQEWESSTLVPFKQSQQQFQKQKQRLDDTLADFQDRFKSNFGERDARFTEMAEDVARAYATGTDKDGRPYSPETAAKKAIQKIKKDDAIIKEAIALKPQNYTQAAFNKVREKKLRKLKPIIKDAKNMGTEGYLYDELIANDTLAPSMIASMIYPPPKEVLDKIKKIPSIRTEGEIAGTYGYDPSHKVSPKILKQAYQQAAELIKEAGGNTSLVGLRGMLAREAKFDETDFDSALELAESEGFERSDMQIRERPRLATPVYWGIMDIFSDDVPSIGRWIRNILGDPN